jgi:hypothetical protein
MYMKVESLILGLVLLSGCAKTSFDGTVPVAALNVINAAMDVPSLNVNFTATPIPYYLYQQPVSYGSSYEWAVAPGDSPIVIVSSLDTSSSIFTGNFKFVPQAIYSLYVLSGTSGGQGNVLFQQDTIPVYTDSAAGVRFINLSPDSHPLTVNLQGNPPSQTEFSPLAYEQISSFKQYSATSVVANNGGYSFEVHDQSTGILYTTITWNYQVYRNNTMVICGSVNPLNTTTPIMVFAVNNY